MAKFSLGALDAAQVFSGQSASDAIRRTTELAPALEDLGYSRYWLAEHHELGIAHSCPEVLAGVLATLTRAMRIGTAGILLRVHSPLRVAKSFRLLNTLFPNRIDLGIARGVPGREVELLLRGGLSEATDFPARVSELLGYLRGDSRVVVNPQGACPPETWILGHSLGSSVALAATHGTAFCFAHFLAREGDDIKAIFAKYRSEFIPSAFLTEEKPAIAIAGICARSDAEAEGLLTRTAPIWVSQSIVGSPQTWIRELCQLHEQTGVTEFVILDLCEKFDDTVRSYQLLAQAAFAAA